jgi:hypothetical protein
MVIDPARLAVSEQLMGEGSYGRVVAGTLTPDAGHCPR